MKHRNNNFTDYAFLLLRSINHINKMLSISLHIKDCADVFCIKNEVNIVSASNFAWVIGGGTNQRINVVTSVNNPSPLTHENY